MMIDQKKSIMFTVGPNGEVDLPAHVLAHLGLPRGGVVKVFKQPRRTLLLRRSGR